MTHHDISSFSLEEATKLIPTISIEELKARFSSYTPDQIEVIVPLLSSSYCKDWRERLQVILSILEEPKSIEVFGRSLDSLQFQEVVDILTLDLSNQRWKLSPLLVGISHKVFTHFLGLASPSQLETMKYEAIAEPLQHQLMLIVHDSLERQPQLSKELDLVENLIQELDVKRLTRHEYFTILDALDRIHLYFEDMLKIINKSLSLAWNTPRIDIVEQLSTIKERTLRLIETLAGHPERSPAALATGLYAKLQGKLHAVFGKGVDAALDDESAFEGLSKLSVWYLRDYWDLGLLPKIVDPEVIDRLNESSSNPERETLRAELLKEAGQNLNRAGLSTVRDLKKAGIFSRSLLREYLSSNK